MTLKIAVIGASGFLGRQVALALHHSGASVVATARTAARLAMLPADVERVAIDIANPAGAYDGLGRPDVVVHLAWEGLPNYGALHHFETELPRQYAFLRQLISDGARSLVVAGTCQEYGMQSGELDELRVPSPTTAYALAKDVLRRQLRLLAEQEPFELTWLRLFYLFGEGQAPTALYTLVKQAIARGDGVFNMSGGEQLRDFLPSEIAADHIARLAFVGKGLGAVNVCSGKPRSVRSLVEGWLGEAGSEMRLNLGYYPYPSYEPMAFWGNADKLKSIVGEV